MMTCHSILLIGLTQDTSVDNHQDVLCPVFNFLCVNDNFGNDIGNDKLCRKLASSQMEEFQMGEPIDTKYPKYRKDRDTKYQMY